MSAEQLAKATDPHSWQTCTARIMKVVMHLFGEVSSASSHTLFMVWRASNLATQEDTRYPDLYTIACHCNRSESRHQGITENLQLLGLTGSQYKPS